MAGEIFQEDPLAETEPDRSISTVWKVISGIGAFLPIGGYALVMPFLMKNGDFLSGGFGSGLPSWFPIALGLGGIWVIAIYGCMGGFIVHAIKNDRFTQQKKIFWSLGIFFGNMIVYPFYWYHHVLHESRRIGQGPNRREQWFIGIMAALPALSLIGYIIFAVIYAMLNPDRSAPEDPTMYIALIITFSFFPMWIYIMVHIFKNKRIDGGKKGLWFTLILLFGGITMPIYWMVQILGKDPVVPPPVPEKESLHDYLGS